MSTSQRARSGVPLDQRSALASVPGVPAWGAVAIAVGATFLGFVIDAARGTELTSAFACLYLIGVVAAVVLVRYRGLFTAAVQAPLILFVAVPLSYQYFTESPGSGLRDILLNVAIPLVNRFPLMLLGTVLALALAGARAFLTKQASHAPAGAAKRSILDRAKETRERAKQSRDRIRENRPRAEEARPRRATAAGANHRDTADGRTADRDTSARRNRSDGTPLAEGRRARREREQSTPERHRARGGTDRSRTSTYRPDREYRPDSAPRRDRESRPDMSARPAARAVPAARSEPAPCSQPPRVQPPRTPRPPQVDPYSAPHGGVHIPPHPVPQVRYRDRGDA
ncbi:MAG: DUF6542 domain-containing protein [Rhodococcus sp. (in: high G+C Gram-positive bacteria)]